MSQAAPATVQRHRTRNCRDLIAWQKAIDLTVETYRLAATLPAVERYALSQQMRRPAASVSANIAEGHGLMSKANLVRHLIIARGSLHELETLFEIARRLNYFDGSVELTATHLADEVGRMLWGLIRKFGTRKWNS